MGEQLEKNIMVLFNLKKYKMAATENEPEIKILSLIGLWKRLVHHLVLDIVVTMLRYVRVGLVM